MITATATATEVQNNFGKYLQMGQDGGEIIVTKNGRGVSGWFLTKKRFFFEGKTTLFFLY